MGRRVRAGDGVVRAAPPVWPPFLLRVGKRKVNVLQVLLVPSVADQNRFTSCAGSVGGFESIRALIHANVNSIVVVEVKSLAASWAAKERAFAVDASRGTSGGVLKERMAGHGVDVQGVSLQILKLRRRTEGSKKLGQSW